jgi:hypothetical protein
MRTRVTNIHRRDEFDEYIGRAGKGLSGYFGNPIPLDDSQSRELVLAKYETYFLNRLEADPEFKAKILGLRGKRLGCFCAPKLCHGMVIVKYLDGVTYDQQMRDYLESIGKVIPPSLFDE